MRKETPLNLCYVPLYEDQRSTVKIMFNNARSLHKHFDEIKDEPYVLVSDVLCFSETRLTNDDQNFTLSGYDGYFNNAKNKKKYAVSWNSIIC